MKNASGLRLATVKMPVTGGGTAIVDGALLMPGTTQGTNLGLMIVGTSTIADAVGILKGPHAVANDSVQAGTTWTYQTIELLTPVPFAEVEYSQAAADDLAVTSSSGTTVTITSLENNADTGWLYATDGTGAGELAFCPAINSGTATTKTAMGWDSTTSVIHIFRVGHKTATINAAGTKFKTQAAAGSWTIFNWENYIDAPHVGISRQLLDPTKHDNLSLIISGNNARPRFFSRITLRSNAGN
jgi:hypothetical protein